VEGILHTSTLPDLQGFPMLMSVSQDAINRRLSEMSLASHQFPSTWELPEPPTDVGAHDYQEELEAYRNSVWHLKVFEFYPAQIDFNSPDVQGCRLLLKIKRGEFTSWSPILTEHGPTIQPVEVDLANLSLYISTPMKQVAHPHPDPNYFSVNRLFVDLENVSMVDLDTASLSRDMQLKVGSSLESGLKNIIFNKLRRIGKNKPDTLLFGEVKIPDRSIPANQREIYPTSLHFSTYKISDSTGDYVTGNLNYLLWFSNPANMPSGDAVGLFNHSWVLPDHDATLVMSDGFYLHNFIIPALLEKYPGIQLKLHRGSWGAGQQAMVEMQNEVYFDLPGLDRCRFTYIHVYIQKEQIFIDYEYRFRHKTVGTWDHYKATGRTIIYISFSDGQFISQTIAPPPVVKSTDSGVRNFFKDMGKGILAVGSFGIAFNSLFNAAEGAYTQAIGLSGLNQEVALVPSLFELPGQASFHFNTGLLHNNLFVGCNYKA
jgi:hypothetical protein